MIADMINNKKLNSIVTELFLRGTKLNISLFFVTQSYFKVRKDIGFKDFIKIYKKCTAKPYSLLVTDVTLASGNPLKFRKSLSEINI